MGFSGFLVGLKFFELFKAFFVGSGVLEVVGLGPNYLGDALMVSIGSTYHDWSTPPPQRTPRNKALRAY